MKLKSIGYRRTSREAAFKAVYGVMVGHSELDQAMELAQAGFALDPESLEWARSLAGGVTGSPQEWVEKLAAHLPDAWPPHRLGAVDRICLLMGCFELWKLGDVPPKVTISEYARLAEKYGDKGSEKFVVGVMSSVWACSPKAEWTPPTEETLAGLESIEPDPTEIPPDDAETAKTDPPKTGWTIKTDEDLAHARSTPDEEHV